MGRRTAIRHLEEHPNLPEILGVLAQLPHIADRDLIRLADVWRNPPLVARARDRALSPDSPLVVEVLSAFDALLALFADDVRGEAEYVSVDPEVTVLALKAVRDAIAAAYARPIMPRAEYSALLAPWRAVYPQPTVAEPDLGPAASTVKSLLATMPVLAARCHDRRARQLFDALVHRAWVTDSEELAAARDAAWNAAVLTSRRRVWALVRRTAAEGLGRFCPECRREPEERDEQRVLGLCVDAACALLVSDALPDEVTDVLTTPLSALIPLPRRAS